MSLLRLGSIDSRSGERSTHHATRSPGPETRVVTRQTTRVGDARSGLPSRGVRVCGWLGQVLFELVAGLHSELAERLAQVIVDGVGANEQPRGGFLVRGAGGREPGDLGFLEAQVVARLDGPFARVLARRLELAASALGERLHAELGEQ